MKGLFYSSAARTTIIMGMRAITGAEKASAMKAIAMNVTPRPPIPAIRDDLGIVAYAQHD